MLDLQNIQYYLNFGVLLLKSGILVHLGLCLGLAVLAACIWLISKVKPTTPQGSCELIPADFQQAE